MDIQKMLRQHFLWQLGNGGIQADLSGANLRGANLTGAKLLGANLIEADLLEANLSDNPLPTFDDLDAIAHSLP